MKRASSSPAVSTQIKNGLNTFLNGAGLQIITTRAEQIEQARLAKLVEKGHWRTAPFSEGLSLHSEQHVEFLKTVCAPYYAELRALPSTPEGPEQFYRNNGWFESVDADVLYGVVRHFAPAQVLEIGSGHSSRLTAKAIRDGQLQTKLICVDPSPRVEVQACADEIIKCPVEELPANELADRLNAGDVLFIDSSHLVRTGGDVVYLYLQVVPRLRPGVLIHAHDIFLPFEYPEEFIVEQHWDWGEQYLVHALLMGNPNFEILWPSCYMRQRHREAVRAILPVEKSFPPPSSLWFRKLSISKR
jgi:predicted O-methyltransferase YrrM